MKSSWISKLANFVAATGQNIQFVAFLLHAFVIAYFLRVWFYGHRWWFIAGVMLFGAVKEFWFDARDETNPPQTFADNLEDFLGYLTGCVIGLL